MLRKKTQWINTRTVWKWDGEKYVQISNEGYEYDGPLALAHNQAATDQQSYRIYASDNSTTVAAENATASCDVDTPYVCRILIENNGDIAEDTQTYSLEYQNTTQATGWQPVSGASSHVQTADASGLTNGTAVTSATLTGQAAATFTNGEEIEDAVGPSIGLAADNYTEYWFAFQLIGADVANNDNIQLRVVGDTLGVLDVYTNTPTITAVESTPTTVTITSDSFTLTDGTMTITQSNPTTVTMTPDSFTLTDGTLTIRAEQETRVTPTADTFTLTDATMGVTQTPVITFVPDSFTLTDGTMGIGQASTVTITMIPDSFTLTDGTLTVRAEQENRITLTPDTFTLTDGTMGVTQTPVIAPIADTFTLTDGTMSIGQAAPVTVTIIPDTFTLTDGTMSVRAEQETRVTLIPDTFTKTDGTLTIRTENETRITLIPDTFTLTDGTLSIRSEGEVRVAPIADTFTITEATMTVTGSDGEAIITDVTKGGASDGDDANLQEIEEKYRKLKEARMERIKLLNKKLKDQSVPVEEKVQVIESEIKEIKEEIKEEIKPITPVSVVTPIRSTLAKEVKVRLPKKAPKGLKPVVKDYEQDLKRLYQLQTEYKQKQREADVIFVAALLIND